MRIRSILYSSGKGNSINWRSCPRDIWRKLFPENFLNSSLVHYIDDNMLIEPDKYYGYLCKVHMLHRMLEKSYKNCILGGEKGTVLHCWWDYKVIQLVWKTAWRFLKKLRILYMFQCHSPKSFHPLPLPQSPKVCSILFLTTAREYFILKFKKTHISQCSLQHYL